jgi:Excalibur calcium-binding domain
MTRRLIQVLALTLTAGSAALVPSAASATVPAKYANCTNLHTYYPHGVGRATARDHVSGTTRPVTTWKHDTAAYNTAIRYNAGLDRDHDSVACEKA